MQVLVKYRDAARAETAGGRGKFGSPSQAQPSPAKEDVMVAYLLIVLLSVLIFLCLPDFGQTAR
jgi:hypothetical protein